MNNFPASSNMLIHLITVSALLLSAQSAPEILVMGEVAQRDPTRPIYQVTFPKLGDTTSLYPSTPSSGPPGTTMQMVTARGQKMSCRLPTPTTSGGPKAGSRKGVENRFDDIDELLDEYKDKCFIRSDGWWTYEFCFGKYVVQKHLVTAEEKAAGAEGESSEGEMKFVLGTLDKEFDRGRRKNVTEVSTKDVIFTQLFGNGTICGPTQEARRVLVKYVCSEDAVQVAGATREVVSGNFNLLKAVREVESCVYEVEFMNSAICKHESYREKVARNAREIRCAVVEGEGVFQGLYSGSYQRASLNL